LLKESTEVISILSGLKNIKATSLRPGFQPIVFPAERGFAISCALTGSEILPVKLYVPFFKVVLSITLTPFAL